MVDPGTPKVETLVLPLSGWVLQWRTDGWWREVQPAQFRAEQAGEAVPDDDWVRWTGKLIRAAKGGSGSGAPRWWLIYDELPLAEEPHVLLGDGTGPPIVILGRIWACEWFSPGQQVTVTVGRERWVVPFDPLDDVSPSA